MEGIQAKSINRAPKAAVNLGDPWIHYTNFKMYVLGSRVLDSGHK
jgi:hypothetical protein